MSSRTRQLPCISTSADEHAISQLLRDRHPSIVFYDWVGPRSGENMALISDISHARTEWVQICEEPSTDGTDCWRRGPLLRFERSREREDRLLAGGLIAGYDDQDPSGARFVASVFRVVRNYLGAKVDVVSGESSRYVAGPDACRWVASD